MKEMQNSPAAAVHDVGSTGSSTRPPSFARGESDPGTLGAAATVPLDDLLDAAACAWSAARTGAVSLPDPPEKRDGLAVAIWY